MQTSPFPSFIEGNVFPVARLSAECFKERKAGSGQTLTGLRKWRGRKPLILIRATLLGHLMARSNDPARDLDVFLRVLTMNEDGRKRRQKKKVDWRTMQGKTYTQKIKAAFRPEEIEGPSPESWAVINAHLGTTAANLVELFQQLSIKRFGEICGVGDCFCDGGSTPFEAARLGLNAHATDLNPSACLLTWGALNSIGGGPEKVAEVKAEQERIYKKSKPKAPSGAAISPKKAGRPSITFTASKVEFPDGWKVPLAPSWVIGQKTKTSARLVPRPSAKRFDFEIVSGVKSMVDGIGRI